MKNFDPINAAKLIIKDDNLIDDLAREFISVIENEAELRQREIKQASVFKWVEKDQRNPDIRHIHLKGFNPSGRNVYVRMYSASDLVLLNELLTRRKTG